MSYEIEIQKVTAAYKALGYDDFKVGQKMIAEFLEKMTGLEDFLDQGPREDDGHFVARVKETMRQMKPVINKIPDRELDGPFAFTYQDAAFLIDDYSDPETLGMAINAFILNSGDEAIGTWYSDENVRNMTVDFLTSHSKVRTKLILDLVKSRIQETDNAQTKSSLKALRDALATATPGQAAAKSGGNSGLSALANTGTQTVAQAFSENKKLIKHLTNYAPAALDLKFVTNLWASVEPEKGEDAIIFTNQHLLIVGTGFGGWLDSGTTNDAYIPVQNIDHLSLGSAHHVQYSGLVSNDSNYWTLAIICTDGSVYERYISLGSNEKAINDARQRLTHTFQYLANFFTVTMDGGHAESSDGYVTTMSYGVWRSF
jgi:hypothetical protein